MTDERERLSEVLPGYELAEEIGRGGWGVVFEATHRTLGRKVAIKYLPAAFLSDPTARDRFRSEAQVVASLDHPHIVPLFDFVEQDDTCVFVMELMPGGTLWDRFTAGEVTHEAACNIALAMLGALHHAHDRDVLHRDVKPENVLFNTEGLPKLADFGIAKVLGEGAGNRTATGTIMGTPAYMAPEQGSGDPVGRATDVYAIGAMLYELLSGQLPFESTGNPLAQLYRHIHEQPTDLREVAPTVPGGIAAVVMRALEKAPADRYEDAAAFAAALNSAATDTLGGDWPARSAIPVLASRALLGRTAGAPSPTTPGSDAASAGNGTGVGAAGPSAPAAGSGAALAPPSPPPSTGANTPAPPATGGAGASGGSVQPAAARAAQHPSPSAAASPPISRPHQAHAPPTSTPSPTSSRSKLPVVLGSLAAVLVAGIAATVLLFSGNGDPGEEADDEPPAAEMDGTTIPAAAIDRFENACEINGVEDELCSCALDRSLDELTPEEFLANDDLLTETGDGLTEDVLARFSACQEELG